MENEEHGSDNEVLTPEEEAERQKRRSILEKNYDILSELEHRTVTIKSNRYDEEDREYYVEKVERAYIDGATGYIPSVKLINSGVRPSLQPQLRIPRDKIPVHDEGNRKVVSLVYTREPSVEHSFYFMNRSERPDLEIYISYEK